MLYIKETKLTKIGAHVSAAGTLISSFTKAYEIGAQCTQIFIAPPRQWSKTTHSKEAMAEYTKTQQQTKIGPNFIHATYLVNLCAKDPAHLEKSIDWLIYALNEATELGIAGVIVHVGSYKDLVYEKAVTQVINAINQIFKNTKQAWLILETSAGMGSSFGSSFKQLGEVIKIVNNPRLKVCLDTCHVFASGYDIKTPAGIKNTLAQFEQEIGLKNLVVIHANDSKFDLGSKKDRHANIGEGFLGKEGFTNLLRSPLLKDIPFILEVPGMLNKGPDAQNVSILKSLISD